MSSVLPITMSSSDALLEDTMMKIAKSAFDTAGNGGKQLRPDVLKSAFFLMHIKIDNEEGERILRKFDVNNNAGLEMNEFLRCARSAHPPNTISCKFKELTESGSQHEFLDGQQARKLLQRLGHVYSQPLFCSSMKIQSLLQHQQHGMNWSWQCTPFWELLQPASWSSSPLSRRQKLRVQLRRSPLSTNCQTRVSQTPFSWFAYVDGEASTSCP
uniref:EF-hand domain-containing protein n=1 Tax=Noccaea caerulescens TaxID=107243 RepID=A0A1J3GFI6_NOCCA